MAVTTLRLSGERFVTTLSDGSRAEYDPRLANLPIRLGASIAAEQYGVSVRGVPNGGSIDFAIGRSDLTDEPEIWAELDKHWRGQEYRVYLARHGDAHDDLELVYTGRVDDLTHDTFIASIKATDGALDLNTPLIEEIYGKVIDQDTPEIDDAAIAVSGNTVTFSAGDLVAAGVRVEAHIWTAGLAAEYLDIPLAATAVTARTIVYDQDIAGTATEWSFSADVPDAIRGLPKPRLWGQAGFLAPVLIDDATQTYQVSIAALSEISSVWVGGVPWEQVASDPTTGQWAPDLAAGTFRLGGITLGGEVRCAAKAEGWESLTSAALIREFVIGAEGAVDEDSLDALDVAAPYLIGFYTGTTPVNIQDALDEVTRGIVGWWAVNADAEIIAGVIEAPTGVATSTEFDLTGLEIVSLRLAGLIPPAWRIRVEYDRNWQPQTTFLATVSEEDQQRWREGGTIAEAFEDESIKDAEPRAVDVPVIRSLVSTEADALDIRDRATAAWGVERRLYDVEARIDAPALYASGSVDYLMVDGTFRAHAVIRSIGGGATALRLWG